MTAFTATGITGAVSSASTAVPATSAAKCAAFWGPASNVIDGVLPAGLSCPKPKAFTVAVLAAEECPYCSSWQKAVIGELKVLGAKVVLNLDAGGSDATQAAQMQEAIAKKPDGIVIWPYGESAIVPSLIAAKAAGIPVELSNSPSAAAGLKDVVAYTGPQNTEEGQVGAQMLAKALNDKGDVIVILGAIGTTPEIQRLAGFETELAKIAPSMKVLGTGDGNWEEATSLSATSALLTRYGSKVSGIFAEDDTTAAGAAKAAAAAGKPKMPIVGVGGSSAGLIGIQNGTIYGTMIQSPYLDGSFGPIMLYDALENLPHASQVLLPLPEVTKANVAKFFPAEW
jgi:ribose transport system substrate-binding protein